MNILQGKFYSTAFRVIDEKAFEADPRILEMQKHIDMFGGTRDGEKLYCITSKETLPETILAVHTRAMLNLLANTSSSIVMEDPAGWLEALQKHLHPDFGIVVIETESNVTFQTYVMTDCVGWARKYQETAASDFNASTLLILKRVEMDSQSEEEALETFSELNKKAPS